MEFLSRTQIILAWGSVVLALFVLDLVRRRKLAEEFSLLWVAATVVIAVLGFSTPLLRAITDLLGMRFESSTVFAFGLVFATAMALFFSVKLSRLTHEHQFVVRELALLRREIEEKQPAQDGSDA